MTNPSWGLDSGDGPRLLRELVTAELRGCLCLGCPGCAPSQQDQELTSAFLTCPVDLFHLLECRDDKNLNLLELSH